MKILVVGSESNLDELNHKFGSNHIYVLAGQNADLSGLIKDADVVFDFVPDKNFIKRSYANVAIPVFLNTSLITLSELTDNLDFPNRDSIFGFGGLPTFVDRPVLEVSMKVKGSEGQLKSICSRLATDFVCVEDRTGLVTPRVICMIINEAYYTLEESTATREDIDMAMKLGTSYPFGPFEWAKRIGVEHVIKLLDAVYASTQDERYRVCSLLRNEMEP